MLIEIWERLHGYNKWTPTLATVESSTLTPIRFGDDTAGKDGKGRAIAWQSMCKIAWDDQDRTRHTAEFEVFEESALYQLTGGDTVTIRFNPNKPEEFHLPGLLQSRLGKLWKMGIWVVLAILTAVLFVVFWFGPSIITALSH
jgi:hypothetical protein